MIDSHCHLDHEYLINNLDEIIERSKQVGLKKILTICTTVNSFIKIKKIIESNDIVYGTYGIHPHEAKNYKITSSQIIKEVKENKKIIGIGETGLDFYYNYSDKIDQINSFEQHIIAAIELNIPLIIHSRNAEKKMFEIFNKYKNEKIKILMHCFTGSKEFADQLLDFNAYFSASGIITFKNSVKLCEVFKSIPLNNLLIETDSPYLAPEPMRGQKNEPSYVKFTANKLAKLKEISEEELVTATTFNFNNLFN